MSSKTNLTNIYMEEKSSFKRFKNHWKSCSGSWAKWKEIWLDYFECSTTDEKPLRKKNERSLTDFSQSFQSLVCLFLCLEYKKIRHQISLSGLKACEEDWSRKHPKQKRETAISYRPSTDNRQIQKETARIQFKNEDNFEKDIILKR